MKSHERALFLILTTKKFQQGWINMSLYFFKQGYGYRWNFIEAYKISKNAYNWHSWDWSVYTMLYLVYIKNCLINSSEFRNHLWMPKSSVYKIFCNKQGWFHEPTYLSKHLTTKEIYVVEIQSSLTVTKGH